MSEQPRFVYQLRGGPFDGKEITGRNDLWREEFYHYDPYALHGATVAIYGFQGYQFNAAPRVLNYWGSQPCDPKRARSAIPGFRSS